MELAPEILEIAKRAHAGQRYGTRPYIEHPLHVARALERFGARAQAAGLLHDVIEDSDITAADLIAAGVDKGVVDAVVALTRQQGTAYADYIDAVAASSERGVALLTEEELAGADVEAGSSVSLAALVKLADNFHNTMASRADGTVQTTQPRYARAAATLCATLLDSVVEAVRRGVDEQR